MKLLKQIPFYIKLLFALLQIVFILVPQQNAHAQIPSAAFTANVQAGCIPLTVQFNNQSAGASNYIWDFGNGNTSTVHNPVIVFNNSGSFNVKLVAISSSGIRDSVQKNSFITTVSKPHVSFTTTNTSACPGSTISFTNTSTFFDSCVWDFGDGITSNQFNPSHVYSLSGNFTVTLICYNSTYGCSSTLTKQNHIIIHSIPAASFYADTTTSCFAAIPFSFHATAQNSSTFLWSFGDASTATGTNTNHTYASSGNYSVTLIATTANGCTDTVVKNNYIHVLSNPIPQPVVDDTSGCAPHSVVFNAPTNGAVSSLWNFGDNTYGTNPYTSHTYSSSGTYHAQLTFTYANGCSNTSAPVSLFVDATPSAQFTVGNVIGCAPLTILPVISTSNNNTTYVWDFGNGDSSLQANTSYTYTTAGNYLLSLTANSSNGCSAQYTYTTTVQVKGPVASFLPNKYSGCDPLVVSFDNNTSNGISYVWDFGDGDTSTAVNPLHQFVGAGSYFVKLIATDINGCKDTVTDINPFQVSSNVTAFNPPQPVTGCAPFTVNFADSSGAVSWLWNFGDGSTSTLSSPTHTYVDPGTYVVSLSTKSNGIGCSQNISNFSTYHIGGGQSVFSHTQTICPPYIGTFTDSTPGAVAWLWSFGDGTTSTQQHPIHIYNSSGHYNVTLTTTFADACQSSVTHNYAMNFDMLSANVVATCYDSMPPFNVQFNANTSGATAWAWSFGDGDSAFTENPQHVFSGTGPFTVTLTLSNGSCSYTYTWPPLSLGMGMLPLDSTNVNGGSQTTHTGCPPYTMFFNNPVFGAVNSLWFFGDSTSSNLTNPVHTYYLPGTYNVTLITTKGNGSIDTLFIPAAVTVPGPVADFTSTTQLNCSGSTASLTNTSIHAASYLWDFGDGVTSTLANPVHQYNASGANYAITLLATDTNGCTSLKTKTFYAAPDNVVNLSATKACAGDTVFFNTYANNFTSYNWNFGDGSNSTQQSTYHVYASGGTYNIILTVTDVAGCSRQFAYNTPLQIDQPIATFTADTPFSNCGWVRIQFNNQSTGADLYQWNFGNGTTSQVVNPLKYWYYNQQQGYFDVSLTATKNGCSSTFVLPQAVYIPDLKVGFTSSQMPGCMPITVNFADTSSGIVSRLWSFGDGISSTIVNPSHTYTSEPQLNVTFTGRDVNGCVMTIVKPVLEIMKTGFWLSDTSGCNPFTLSIIDTSQHVKNYSWNFGDGTVDTTNFPTHTYNQNGVYDLTLTATSNYGCTQTITLDSAIRVSSPVADFSIVNTTGCAPLYSTFNNLSVNGINYQWDFGDGATSSDANPDHIYTTPGNYTVSLTTTGQGNCSQTKTIQQAVTVLGPVADFSVTATNGCAPFTIQITNSSTNVVSYNWNFGDGDSSASANPQHTYTNSGSYQLMLSVADSIGCKGIYIHPSAINIAATPVADFAVSDSVICVQSQINFINNSVGGNTYTWDFGDGNMSASFNTTHQYNQPGVYSVKLVAGNGACADTILKQQLIKVVPYPVANFSANNQSGCAPLAVSFVNQSQVLQNQTYLWSFGNGVTNTTANPMQFYSLPGSFTVSLKVINEGVCADSITKPNYINAVTSAPPSVVPILSVSVKDDRNIDILWQNSSATNLSRYELYRRDNSNAQFNLIYSDLNPKNSNWNVSSSYQDSTVSTDISFYSYKIQTVNMCNSKISLDSSTAHTSILLHATAQQDAIALSWNYYEGCDVGGYEIVRSDDGANFKSVLIVDALTNSIIDSTAFCPFSYSYRIIAFDLCGKPFESMSNITEATPSSSLTQQKVEVSRTTVVDNNHLLTEWLPPLVSPEKVVRYVIYRSVDSLQMESIGSVPAPETSFSDMDVNVHQLSYIYKIEIENICQVQTLPGNVAKSVLLNSQLDGSNRSLLHWNKYEGWDTGVEKYEIQKQDESGIWQTVKTVDGNTNSVED